jgi:hypothetical protein
LPSIIEGYEPENIANGDETGLDIDKDVETEPDTRDIHALVQNFRESREGRQEEV